MRRIIALAICGLLIMGALPASAVPVPVLASNNVEVLYTLPDSVGAISTTFNPTAPVMYVNTLQGVSIYDTTDPAMPVLTGRLELPHFENEGMTLGQREDGTTFLLIGIDLVAVDPLTGQRSVDGSSFYVADVTDPAAPVIRSFTNVDTSTHTISCMSLSCEIAWTSGVYQGGKMEAIDLTDLDQPQVVSDLTNINGTGSFGVHQWTIDDAGFVVGAGGRGTGIYDISDPLAPVALNTTDVNGSLAPYNDFIQHNADRPNGNAFPADLTVEEQVALGADGYSVEEGNVLVVTEEDYDSPDCQGTTGIDAPEGGVSTWGIPYLDTDQHLADNPEQAGDAGSIVPLDTWNTELYDLGVPTPIGALCSAHYFTYHDAGFIAQGWYGQGTRILDVRDPQNITQVGYFIPQGSEVWHAYWAPERDDAGAVTGADSDIVYTNDVARGVDVLRVDLPETAPAATQALVAPILPEWLDMTASPLSAPDASLGYQCRLATPATIAQSLAPRPTTALALPSR